MNLKQHYHHVWNHTRHHLPTTHHTQQPTPSIHTATQYSMPARTPALRHLMISSKISNLAYKPPAHPMPPARPSHQTEKSADATKLPRHAFDRKRRRGKR